MLNLLADLSSALMALTGFISVVLTNQINPIISLLGLIFISIAIFFFVFNIKPRIHKPIWDTVIIIAFLIMLVDLFWISSSLLISIVHFSILLTINKLFNLNTKKDYMQVYLISLLQFLAASTMTTKLFFALAVIIFLISATWTLILFHLKFQISDNPPSPPFNKGGMGGFPGEKIVDLPFFFSTNLVALAAFLITILIFFLIPRFGIGFLQKKSDNRIRTSGFSERIDLGDIAPIKLDDSMVMRIRIPDYNDSLKDTIYWRGVTFDFYNGHSWSNNLAKRFNPEINGKGESIINKGLRGKGLYQEIILEPLDTTVLFAASHIERLDGRLPSIKKDMMGSIYTPYPPFSRIQYSAYSRLDSISEEDKLLESKSYPPDIERPYLQLPDETEKIGDLARSITSDSKGIIDKINAVERYLKENYRYTLDVEPAKAENPIEDFLFRQKAGYCEYYATAMVIMLRGIGIPSRLVTGFLAGEWNEIGGYFTVRQKDAHTWVEAYLPRSGWVTFDPTPPVLLNDQGTMFSLLSKFIDSLRLKWDRYIINYSLKDQVEAIKKTRDKIRSMQDDFLMLYESIRRSMLNILGGLVIYNLIPKRPILLILIISSLLSALYLYFYIKKGYRLSPIYFRLRYNESSQIVELYNRMLKLLEKKGFTKEKNITPLEFATSLATYGEEISKGVLEVTGTYYKVRYGHQPLSWEEISRIDEIFLKIKRGFSGQKKLFKKQPPP